MNPENNNSDEYKNVNLKELWKISKWAFGLLYSISPVHAVAYFSISLVNNIFDLVNAFIFGKILDVVIKLATSSDAHVEQLYPYLALMLFYNMARSLISFIYRYTSFSLRTYARFKTTKILYDKIQTLQMQSLEQPDVTNKIHRARMHLDDLLEYFYEANILMSSIVSLIVSSVIVIRTIPFLLPLLVLISIPRFITDRKYRKLVYKFSFENTEKVRMNSQNSSDLSTPTVLQEVFINGAYEYLDSKYMTFANWFAKTRIKLQRSWVSRSYMTLFLGDLGTMFANVLVFTRLIAKQITVGDSTFQIRIISSVKDSLFNIVVNINDLSEMAIRIKDTYDLFHWVPAFNDGSIIIPKLKEGPTLTFKNVRFKYPRTDRYIIDGLNLDIKSGEKIAIVGHNGAGKTTLVRLLCRMYQTTNGEIIVNGANINDLKIDDWYKNMGVLFQDFVTYPQLTVSENILIGAPHENVDKEKIIKAATSADAMDFINQFPNKFDQILSERYKGGIKPSTGQWQKIAIARFFYRNAPLVIFDEPTASIDAISEYNIFNRIYDFFKDKTVIIISHRFSTVRNADRIVMLDQGKIAEEGTHEELMKLNGLYAKSFLLQAEGYTIY